MKESQKRSMAIHFNHGSMRLLGFPAPVPDSDANLAARSPIRCDGVCDQARPVASSNARALATGAVSSPSVSCSAT